MKGRYGSMVLLIWLTSGQKLRDELKQKTKILGQGKTCAYEQQIHMHESKIYTKTFCLIVFRLKLWGRLIDNPQQKLQNQIALTIYTSYRRNMFVLTE